MDCDGSVDGAFDGDILYLVVMVISVGRALEVVFVVVIGGGRNTVSKDLVVLIVEFSSLCLISFL